MELCAGHVPVRTEAIRQVSVEKAAPAPAGRLWDLQQDGLVGGDDVPIHVKVALHWLP